MLCFSGLGVVDGWDATASASLLSCDGIGPHSMILLLCWGWHACQTERYSSVGFCVASCQEALLSVPQCWPWIHPRFGDPGWSILHLSLAQCLACAGRGILFLKCLVTEAFARLWCSVSCGAAAGLSVTRLHVPLVSLPLGNAVLLVAVSVRPLDGVGVHTPSKTAWRHPVGPVVFWELSFSSKPYLLPP